MFPVLTLNLYPLQYRGFGFQRVEAILQYETDHSRMLLVSAELEVRLARWLGVGGATGGQREGNRKLTERMPHVCADFSATKTLRQKLGHTTVNGTLSAKASTPHPR